MNLDSIKKSAVLIVFISFILIQPAVKAHCDTLDGPVVNDAKKALELSDVNIVLKWIQKDDEKEIKTAFDKTLIVRQKGKDAKELADMYFFETMVRLHRAGEGAPYTGLKPAGTELSPAVIAADEALESGQIDNLMKLLNTEIEKGLHSKFAKAIKAKETQHISPEDGRRFVAAYVEFVHYGEGLYETAKTESKHDHNETAVEKNMPHEHKEKKY
ncbi:MAG: DUF6448 family protein [Phycisphaerae bacterium]|nr:DUF6448 family protein [Phycisphaerae bacterium]